MADSLRKMKMTSETGNINDNGSDARNCIDYDVHGLVGIRLINPSPDDGKAVAKQLGPLQSLLTREPDITIRFAQNLPTPNLRYLGVNMAGFNEDGFYVLYNKKSRRRSASPSSKSAGLVKSFARADYNRCRC